MNLDYAEGWKQPTHKVRDFIIGLATVIVILTALYLIAFI